MKRTVLSLLAVCALLFGVVGTSLPAKAAEISSTSQTETTYSFVGEVNDWNDIAIMSKAWKDFVSSYPESTEAEQNKFLLNFVESGHLRQVESSEITQNGIDANILGYGYGGDLNAEEKKLALRHPVQAVKVYNAAQRATDLTVSNYGHNGYQDNSDAFRHCLWSALMKQSIGTAAAKEWGTAHEADSSGVDKQMDLFNNNVGRSINVSGSESSIVNSVKSLVKSGKLRRIVKNKLVPTDKTGLK
jgi:hypothetical protein